MLVPQTRIEKSFLGKPVEIDLIGKLGRSKFS
jgi:hypothetical protein